VLLTNADLDHTLGLFLMREGERLAIHSTPAVQRSLSKALSLAPVLGAFCGVQWVRPPVKPLPLVYRDGSASGLLYHAVPLPGHPPRYVRQRRAATAGHVIGYRIIDAKTGGRLLFLPDVAELTKGLLGLLGDCDVLLFDGTFWANDELRRAGVGTLTASAMGHLPISGTHGSLKALARLPVKHKVFVHINNTNPMLLENSPERAAVLEAGCTVGRDGMEFEV
jgi:pyrroloquinoline quinone biosynthesis protein B